MRILKSNQEWKYVIILLWFFLPLLLILLKNSVTYTFRHLLIFVPPLVILAIYGLQFLVENASKNKYYTYLLGLILIINFGYLAYQNISLHPYEISYFNVLSGGLQNNYEKFVVEPDTLSISDGAKWMCEKYRSRNITYSGPFINTYVNYFCPDNTHLVYVEDYNSADIIVTFHSYTKMTAVPSYYRPFHSINRQGVPLLIYYAKQDQDLLLP